MREFFSLFFDFFSKTERYFRFSALNHQIPFCGVILLIVFQLLPPTTEAKSLITDEISFRSLISQTSNSQQQNIRDLKPGETIERQAEAAEKQSYAITLEVGQSVTVTIPKYNMALAARILSPDSEQIAQIAQQREEIIVQPLVITAEKSGAYRVDVFFSWSGSYSITCSPLRQTTETDKQHSAAQKLYVDYLIKLVNNPNIPPPERLRKRLEKLQERLAIYRTLNDPQLVGISLIDLARFYDYLGDDAKKIDSYNEALEILQSNGNVAEVCEILISLAGDAANRKGDYQKAIDYLNQALFLSRSKSYKNGEYSSLQQLGNFYSVLADERKALDFYEQALATIRSTDSSGPFFVLNEATTLSTIGNLYRGISVEDEKIPDFFKDTPTADHEKALEYYRQALEIFRNVKNAKKHRFAETSEAAMLLNIGNTYKELGNYREALSYLEQSLELYKNLKYQKGQVGVLKNIGNLYSLKGEYAKSFEYLEQTSTLLKKGTDNDNYAWFLNSIARDYHRAGETQKALELCSEALTLSRSREQQTISAASLFEMAQIERDLGNFNNARNRIEEALQIVESIRANISALEGRASYFATVKRYYDFYIELLMQAHKSQPEKNFDALALRISEKARARSLLDLLSIAQVNIKQGVDPQLLERERVIREQLSEKANQQNRLLLGKFTEEQAAKINKEITDLTNQYEEIQAKIRSKSPRYASLTQPGLLDAKQIQQLLDSGTILLEYSLGEKKSYLWAVSADSVASFDLPGREVIETQTRKIYELLTARNQQTKNETDEQRRNRLKIAEAELTEEGAKLSRMLLAPAAALLGNKRLLVVPDGALHYIPFSALPAPKNNDLIVAPLGAEHEIVSLPSASTLALLREEFQNRKPAPKMLAVFADPVFSRTDVRLNYRSGNQKRARTRKNSNRSGENLISDNKIEIRDFSRAADDVGLITGESAELPRLPFSRREADSIFKVSPKNLRLKKVDFAASKEDVFNSDLEQYRLVHFATHGLLNSRHAELSGVVLSLLDKNGGEVDGFLRLQDIYNLRLSADLVVLSACSSALGKDVKGEGLVGLTRGFMYAGAPRVVASLWKVDDAATAALMSIFYQKMLMENLRPAAALRAAQNEMRQQTRWKSPYYWAPFILQGEWK